jgi:hypothetical protein
VVFKEVCNNLFLADFGLATMLSKPNSARLGTAKVDMLHFISIVII